MSRLVCSIYFLHVTSKKFGQKAGTFDWHTLPKCWEIKDWFSDAGYQTTKILRWPQTLQWGQTKGRCCAGSTGILQLLQNGNVPSLSCLSADQRCQSHSVSLYIVRCTFPPVVIADIQSFEMGRLRRLQQRHRKGCLSQAIKTTSRFDSPPLVQWQIARLALLLSLCVSTWFSTKQEEGCTVPGGTAVPGRCVEWTEQAPFSAPSSKNPFNMFVPL